MNVDDRERLELIGLIEAAFKDAQYPGDDLLFLGNEYVELEPFRGRFTNRDWRQIPTEFIEDNFDCLPLISPPAYPYFLPAYITVALGRPDRSIVSDFLVYNLFAGGSPRESSFAKFDCLSPQQKVAVLRFLEFVVKRYSMKEAGIAIKNYWGRFDGLST